MEVNFGSSRPFSVGVEEEFQIVNGESFELVSRFDEIEESAGLRERLSDAAAENGMRILSAGTHPFSRYEDQDVTDEPRYRELIEDMQWVAEQELIFGLHTHVGMPDPHTAIAVANGLR